MTELTKIVWREWFNEAAVKQLTEMGTLPRNETDIDIRYMDGDSIAAVAVKVNDPREEILFRIQEEKRQIDIIRQLAAGPEK